MGPKSFYSCESMKHTVDFGGIIYQLLCYFPLGQLQTHFGPTLYDGVHTAGQA